VRPSVDVGGGAPDLNPSRGIPWWENRRALIGVTILYCRARPRIRRGIKFGLRSGQPKHETSGALRSSESFRLSRSTPRRWLLVPQGEKNYLVRTLASIVRHLCGKTETCRDHESRPLPGIDGDQPGSACFRSRAVFAYVRDESDRRARIDEGQGPARCLTPPVAVDAAPLPLQEPDRFRRDLLQSALVQNEDLTSSADAARRDDRRYLWLIGPDPRRRPTSPSGHGSDRGRSSRPIVAHPKKKKKPTSPRRP